MLWSPDGKKLVVNDYAGSDFSKILIFSADQDSPPQDVGAELLQSLKDSPDRRSLADNHHVYFAVSTWEGNDAVKLKVWGHGEVYQRASPGCISTLLVVLSGECAKVW